MAGCADIAGIMGEMERGIKKELTNAALSIILCKSSAADEIIRISTVFKIATYHGTFMP